VLPKPPCSLFVLSCVAGLAVATPVPAVELGLGPPRQQDGRVWADVRIDDVLSSRVESSLSRGMPATLHVHTELWRHRGAWFDRLESAFDVAAKIRYEVWSKSFLVEWKGTAPVSFASLDSVRAFLSRPLALPVGRIEKLAADGRYFLVATATLKPLTVEDVEEGEGWLSGEVENKRGKGLGIVTAIPRSLFDAVRNFTGLGDERARQISPVFSLEAPEGPG
jgi:hypothetical protein